MHPLVLGDPCICTPPSLDSLRTAGPYPGIEFVVWKGTLDRQSCCHGHLTSRAHGGSSCGPLSWNACLHVAHACSSHRALLDFPTGMICFYFPCHKDEASSYFMVNLLNSKPPMWSAPVGLCGIHGLSPDSMCWLKNHASMAWAVVVHVNSRLLPSRSSAIDRTGPWKPPCQDRFIFRRSLWGLEF